MGYWFAGKYYNPAEKVGADGEKPEALSIEPSHPALAYGASVFTTIRVYENRLEHPLTAWQEHCDRITQSLQTFTWPQPSWNTVATGCHTLLAQYPVLRLAVLADGSELITGRSLPPNLKQQQTKGVTAWVAAGEQYQRGLPYHKTGNYLPCWLALRAAQTHGARDAILVNNKNEWLETSTGNLWGYHNGRWWTPPLSSGLLPGIARARLLRTVTNAAVDAPWTTERVRTFECLAYSNCVVGILPIHTVLLGNIKLNYRSTHESLSALRQVFLPSSHARTKLSG